MKESEEQVEARRLDGVIRENLKELGYDEL
jgi:hypothetical protein